MFRMEHMKALVEERLTSAVEDVLGIIDNVIKYYEEKDSRSKSEISRQNSLLDVLLKPKTTLQRADPPQFSAYKEEVPPEQQERSPSLDQEDPELFQIKEEQEETWTSQVEEQLQGLQETDTKDSIYTVTAIRGLYDQHQSWSQHLNQTVENREGEPLPSTSTEHMRTEAYGEGCGYSEPTIDWQSLSSDRSVAESEDTDRDDSMVEGRGPQSGLKTKTLQTVKILRSGVSSKGMLFDTGEKPHGCVHCGKRFTSNTHLNMHMRIHTGSKPYSCSVCGKMFRHRHHVQYHMRTHTGERPYSCPVCGKGFSRQNVVQVHMKTHTGERPYSCSVCGKGFIKSPHLQRHMKTHTGERPYSCTICGKGFCRRDSVQDHMRTHTGERPYSCSVCAKRFTRSSVLKKHMKTHTGETP